MKQKWTQACSQHADAAVAVADIYRDLNPSEAAIVIFYCSNTYDKTALAEAFAQWFGDIPVIGATTAGEISASGYTTASLVAISLDQQYFQVDCLLISHLQQFNMASTLQACQQFRQDFNSNDEILDPDHHFGFLLVDGLSKKEEVIVTTLYEVLAGISLFGGSTADGLDFQKTYIYYQGTFHTDCALLTLVHSQHPIKVFKTEHFHATENAVVVTEADATQRIVYELNGMPAAQEYARLLGLPVEQLSPAVYAVSPLVVKVAGQYHVRSILAHNPEDDSLSFYCAVDTGMVLRIAKCGDLISNLHHTLDRLSAEMGGIDLILACDCLLRRLEIERKTLYPAMNQLVQQYHIFGFNTYGEQLNALHINQTFTGVAIAK